MGARSITNELLAIVARQHAIRHLLTAREIDILHAALDDTRRATLAEVAGVLPSTVKTHVRHILAKSRAPSLDALVIRLLRETLSRLAEAIDAPRSSRVRRRTSSTRASTGRRRIAG